ncbi:pleckstrin homology domain-containing family J member 1-like [Hylaeus anthracinus]|uniref:pleckstrin homology domain-containing family J member 1-like n=1 Tax=Hylaeus anthracinus TaxID=313031 RepID=UPI0023B8F55B|nr:pleckstrin homology domain-containing family J member 1-like [Hylaeus anthracinus]
MKFNEKELAEASNGHAALEGRLNHKRAHKSVFKEKWFKLRYNLLFYFNINELGHIDRRQPAGVIVLENYCINIDSACEGVFAFSIAFRDDHEKRHILSGRSESQVEQWVNALNRASYEYWRSRLIMLQEKLSRKTGEDPLLVYPTFRSHQPSSSMSAVSSTALSTVTKEANLIEF